MDREIQRKLDKLAALESGGVDNWEFYSDSLKEWHKEGHTQDCIEETMREIDELLVEAKVDEPAGRGAGYSIDYNRENMFRILSKMINNINE